MHSAAFLLVAATLGVDFGWKALPNDEVEYIIQIEPALLDSLENGEAVFSELLPEVRANVRRLRIQVGNQPLPREAVSRRLRPRTSDVESDATETKQARHETPAIQAPKLDESPPRPPAPDRNGETETGREAEKPIAAESKPEVKADMSSSVAPAAPERPDNWLIAAMVALFVSLGANLYLGWVVTSVRRNYHKLVDSLYARNTSGSGAA
jgi:hypothetical protein